MQKRLLAAYISVALVALASIMAFFARPQPSSIEMVTQQQELPDPRAHYAQDSGLAARVSKSYGLALVLVISEYSRKNAVALEALRSWAHDNFQRDPSFLHSVDVKPVHRDHVSFIDAFCYSLFAAPTYLLEDQTQEFLRQRIAAFHATRPYQSFRADYFDSFGLDRESALMLARYQSERARQSVGVLLSIAYWCFALMVGTIAFFKYSVAVRSTRWQRMLAFFWFSSALYYIIVSWMRNDVSVLVSSLVCALIGLYTRRPIAISFGEDKGLSFRLLVPDRRVLLLGTWATVSIVAIQLFVWVHTGSFTEPDPVTLLISALTGDFLHDPTNAKRNVLRITGAIWLLLGCWTAWSIFHESRVTENIEEGLAPLKDGL